MSHIEGVVDEGMVQSLLAKGGYWKEGNWVVTKMARSSFLAVGGSEEEADVLAKTNYLMAKGVLLRLTG